MSNSKDSSSYKPSSDGQQDQHDRPQYASDDTTMQEAENVTGTNVEIEGDSSSATPFMAQETGDDDNIVIEPQEGSSKKQGGQRDELGALSSGVHKPKRKVELVDPPTLRDPICIVCSKQFGSWKAVFGHMRSHPGRHWRGVFPPPTGIWDPLRDIDQKASGPNIDPNNISPQAQEEIATTLLNVARGVLQRLNDSDKNEGVIAISEAASSSSLGRGLGIDLNQPQEKSPSTALVLDLNKPAKEKDDDSSSDDGK